MTHTPLFVTETMAEARDELERLSGEDTEFLQSQLDDAIAKVTRLNEAFPALLEALEAFARLDADPTENAIVSASWLAMLDGYIIDARQAIALAKGQEVTT